MGTKNGDEFCHAYVLCLFVFFIWEQPGTNKVYFGATGATTDHFGRIICTSVFSRNPQIKKVNFSIVSCDSEGNRCKITSPRHCPTIGSWKYCGSCMVYLYHRWGAIQWHELQLAQRAHLFNTTRASLAQRIQANTSVQRTRHVPTPTSEKREAL